MAVWLQSLTHGRRPLHIDWVDSVGLCIELSVEWGTSSTAFSSETTTESVVSPSGLCILSPLERFLKIKALLDKRTDDLLEHYASWTPYHTACLWTHLELRFSLLCVTNEIALLNIMMTYASACCLGKESTPGFWTDANSTFLTVSHNASPSVKANFVSYLHDVGGKLLNLIALILAGNRNLFGGFV